MGPTSILPHRPLSLASWKWFAGQPTHHLSVILEWCGNISRTPDFPPVHHTPSSRLVLPASDFCDPTHPNGPRRLHPFRLRLLLFFLTTNSLWNLSSQHRVAFLGRLAIRYYTRSSTEYSVHSAMTSIVSFFLSSHPILVPYHHHITTSPHHHITYLSLLPYRSAVEVRDTYCTLSTSLARIFLPCAV